MKVLTVCLGNICRSPAAQGLLEHLVAQQYLDIEVDSAGTAAYHLGKHPDRRSIEALAQIGVDISRQRARQVTRQDFYDFDWILAMDRANLSNLQDICPEDASAEVVMLGNFRKGFNGGEVADPYWGDESDFEKMREHLLRLLQDFTAHIKSL